MTEEFLLKKLEDRISVNGLRALTPSAGIDFSSNDYLGFARNRVISARAQAIIAEEQLFPNGSTGSRLISGHHPFADRLEKQIAHFHRAEAALIFNSGYDANLGFFSCVAQRGDTIFYDYLAHASIRDGIRLSNAKAFSFPHNDLAQLQLKLSRAQGNVFVVVESVYSMDGDEAPLRELASLCDDHNARLVVDEAHSTGIYGPQGSGLVPQYELEEAVFARLHTFGKALGCHGAAWLGSDLLRNYLINFSRSFIYTTAISPHALATVAAAYEQLPASDPLREQLFNNIAYFRKCFGNRCLASGSPVQSIIIPGNAEVMRRAEAIQALGFAVKAVRYPTVPEGTERIRIILHAFNTREEIDALHQAVHKTA